MTTFGLAKHCKAEEIRSIYLKLAKVQHPDVKLVAYEQAHGQKPSEEATAKIEEKFKELSSAYERLTEWTKERD